ncbi:hypothetical protein ACF09J_07615 [Streptomyces sp. NPDC014889]|uniref:hypothetical protein n=1 Tax=Streptomyces sp. NPDC014889 TaxID=3364928 RepID=UPI0036F8FF10
MDIDPTQPWGIALDYAGRAMKPVQEGPFTVDVAVQDSEPNRRNTPCVRATIFVQTPDGEFSDTLAYADVSASMGTYWEPNPDKVKAAVEQAVAQAHAKLDWLASLRG